MCWSAIARGVVLACALVACGALDKGSSPTIRRERRVLSEPIVGPVRREKQLSVAVSPTAELLTAVRAKPRPNKLPSKRSIQIQYPFYHTSDELKAEIAHLASTCQDSLTVSAHSDGDVTLDVVTVRRRAAGAEPINRVFMLFGEHSRELIGPESGLAMLRKLCQDESSASVLEHSEFQLVLNANPLSRVRVEEGEYCLRTNPSGVDLNRNWDMKWQGDDGHEDDTAPGPRPFSEPETRIMRRLVSKYMPTTFVSVHSGTRGMYMPYAYDTSVLAKRNQPRMLAILKELDADHCHCPYGAAGQEVGYACPGTCLDWVFAKLNSSFSFAFEIYVGSDHGRGLQHRWEEKLREGGAKLLDDGHHLGHEHFKDLFSDHGSDFVGNSLVDAAAAGDPPSCFALFNPTTKESYDNTVSNWASAYIETAEKVVLSMQRESSQEEGNENTAGDSPVEEQKDEEPI